MFWDNIGVTNLRLFLTAYVSYTSARLFSGLLDGNWSFPYLFVGEKKKLRIDLYTINTNNYVLYMSTSKQLALLD